MGLRDTAEQLEAAQAQSVRDEQEIAELRVTLEGMARQNAELEHDLARAESALADRLQHDAHTRPTTATIDRDAVIDAYQQIWEEYQRTDRPRLFRDALADVILALVQPVDGVVLTPEEAQLAVRACRHSAESIRSVLDVDPARLHPDVAPYVERLTDLADRLQEHTS